MLRLFFRRLTRSFTTTAAATILVAVSALMLAAPPADATVVRFDTVFGDVDVMLFDDVVGETVANFLQYALDDAYVCSVFHRSTSVQNDGFGVLQGGSFFYEGQRNLSSPSVLSATETRDPIALDAVLSNRRGTLAMARQFPEDSATSGIYFNMDDANAAAFDSRYAVFGEVITGMDVLDQFHALEPINFTDPLDPASGAYGATPMRDYTQADADADTLIGGGSNFAIIKNVSIIDSDLSTAEDAAHLLITPDTSEEPAADDLGSEHVVPGGDDATSEPLLLSDGEVLDAVSGSAAASADAGTEPVAAGGSSASQGVSALPNARTVSNPEPATAALFASGLLLAVGRMRRR